MVTLWLVVEIDEYNDVIGARSAFLPDELEAKNLIPSLPALPAGHSYDTASVTFELN